MKEFPILTLVSYKNYEIFHSYFQDLINNKKTIEGNKYNKIINFLSFTNKNFYEKIKQ